MKRFVLCSCVLLSLTACDRAQRTFENGSPTTQPQPLPVANLLISGRSFVVEVAADPATQEHGLMDRDTLAPDRGMIFVFPDEQPRNFWMKNTRIPLDILYLDHAGKVVSISTMKPFDLTSVPSNAPAQYAIELNAGMANAIGAKPGDVISIPPSLTKH